MTQVYTASFDHKLIARSICCPLIRELNVASYSQLLLTVDIWLILMFFLSLCRWQFVRECEARLVEDYKVDYLYDHVKEMVTKEKRQDLANLFILLNGIPKALNPVVEEFQQHVQELGEYKLMM